MASEYNHQPKKRKKENLPSNYTATIDDIKDILNSSQGFKAILVSGIREYLNENTPESKVIEEAISPYIIPLSETLQKWSDEIPCGTIEKLEKEIRDESPTLENIAKSKIPHEDKKNCLRLYKILHNLYPMSEDYIRTEREIISMLKSTSKLDSEHIKKLEENEVHLKAFQESEHVSLKEKILGLDADDFNKSIIYQKYIEFENMCPADSLHSSHKEWMKWAIQLPYQRYKKIFDCLEEKGEKSSELSFNHKIFQLLLKVKNHLNKKVFSMGKLKEELLTYIHDIALGIQRSKILLLESSSGCGKKLMMKACAEALDWPFYCISCGGIEDSSLSKGQERLNRNSPSLFIPAFCSMKFNNGILLFEEIEKLGIKAQESLLDFLEKYQNNEWKDAFLYELNINTNGLFIVLTSTDLEDVIPPLKSRVQRFYISSYEAKEKAEILGNFILPSVLEERGISRDSIFIAKDGMDALLARCGTETSGMNELRSILAIIISKIHLYMTIKDSNNGDNNENLGLSYYIKKMNGTPLSYPIVLGADMINILYNSKNDGEKRTINSMYI